MSSYWNERIKNLSPYVPGEQPRDRQFIKLNTNENPYPPSPKVIEAIKNAANGDLRLYPSPDSVAFREAAAARYGVKPSQIFAGNGSDEILAFAFGAFFESGQKDESRGDKTPPVLFPDITYSFYPVYAGLWDIPYRAIPLCEDFSVKSADYKVYSGGAIMPNPNAPTGVALPLDEILSIADFLKEQKKVFIVDEAYIAFSAESAAKLPAQNAAKFPALSAVPYIEKYPNLLTVHTMSKSASLAGLRFGFAIGSEELIEGLCRIRDSFNSYTIDRLAMAGAAAAVNDASYYNEINSRVTATRERTAQELRGLGFNVLPSAANFLFIKAPGIGGVEIFKKLREKGILVRHFNKERIADYLRVSIGTDEDMNTFLDVCKEIING